MCGFIFLLIILSIIDTIVLVSSGETELMIMGIVGGIYQIGLLFVILALLDKIENLEERINKN